MKLLHICCGFPLETQGGITNYVRNIADEQAKNGNEVYILSDSGENSAYTVIPYTSHISKFYCNPQSDSQSISQIKDILESYQFDLIHIHMMLNVDQTIYEILKPYRYIVSLHDYYYLCPRIHMVAPGHIRCVCVNSQCDKCFSVIEANQRVFKLLRKFRLQNFAHFFPIRSKTTFRKWYTRNKMLLEGAELLLPVSNRVEEIYRNSGIDGAYRMLHIGNSSALDYKANYQYVKGDYINLIVLSSLSELKGGKLIVEILSRVTNPLIRVHFYGGSGRKEKIFMRKIGIIDHGKYLQGDLPEILKGMDMGIVVPIWEDNGPQVVMEMLNNHVPVLATKMGGIPDFVNNDNGFLFDPFSPEECNAAISFLNNLNHETIRNMKQHICRTITPSEHYTMLMKCYQDVLNGNNIIP